MNIQILKTNLEWAIYYYTHYKWSVIPISQDKSPLISWKKYQSEKADIEQIKKWWKEYPNANIGVVTGQISNLVVVDIDPRHGGSNEQFKNINTAIVKTGGGGWHYYFKYKEGVKNSTNLLQGIDIRGTGGYIIAPPSIHASGQLYAWEKELAQSGLQSFPYFILKILANTQNHQELNQKLFDSSIVKGVAEGSRNEAAASYIGKLLAHIPEDDSESLVWETAKIWNKNNNPPLEEKELKSVYESIKTRQKNSKSNIAGKRKQVGQLYIDAILEQGFTLFHDQYKNTYASISGDGKEIYSIQSTEFTKYILQLIYKQFGKFPTSEQQKAILNFLDGKAYFEGILLPLEVRIVKQNNNIYYDLNPYSVEISKKQWDILATPPILFKRYNHQKPQIEPSKVPCDIKEIFRFINIKEEQSKVLLLVYLITAFIPDFPHPLLVIHGTQGASKTTTFKFLKSLIDPSMLTALSAPESEKEFIQLASHHYFFFFDNLSHIKNWFSDALARASTGGSFSKRKLYTDDDDIIYAFRKVMGMNGINQVIEKSDLLDRSILISLDRISPEKRRGEKELLEEFELLKPQLLGAIFTIISSALRIYPTVSLSKTYRMADFTKWGCAIAEALGYSHADFLDAYKANIQFQSDAAIEASPVGICIITFMEKREHWQGSASDLLGLLEEIAEHMKINIKTDKKWVKSPEYLSRRLKEIEPNLIDAGITVSLTRTRYKRLISLSKNECTTVTPSQVATEQINRNDGTLNPVTRAVKNSKSLHKQSDSMTLMTEDFEKILEVDHPTP